MIRSGRAADLSAITHVRTSVVENHLSVAQMAALGITPQSVIADMEAGTLGCWVWDEEGQVTGFSMADRRDGSIFALFVLPGHEGRGIGSRLLAACEAWLKSHGHSAVRLSTGRNTIAHGFYQRRGWQIAEAAADLHPEDDTFTKAL